MSLMNLDSSPIFNTINEIVPPTAHPVPDISMNPQKKRAREEPEQDATLNAIMSHAGPNTARAHGRA
eukprot:1146718-Pelagomonas_calceolata.AAC.2